MTQSTLLESIFKKEKYISGGLSFPTNSFMDIFLSYIDRKELRAENLNESVLRYIKKNKSVNISELSEVFDLELDEALLILKQLEEDGKIKLSGSI